jgi:hypothetical protein
MVDDEMFETSLELDDDKDVDNPSKKVQKSCLSSRWQDLRCLSKSEKGKRHPSFPNQPFNQKRNLTGMPVQQNLTILLKQLIMLHPQCKQKRSPAFQMVSLPI